MGAEQLAIAEKLKSELQESPAFQGRKIVTEIEPAEMFYPAEDYHQDYIEKTGRSCHVDIDGAFRKAPSMSTWQDRPVFSM